jgi:hypothetical protein
MELLNGDIHINQVSYFTISSTEITKIGTMKQHTMLQWQLLASGKQMDVREDLAILWKTSARGAQIDVKKDIGQMW